jgi:hypothetical protein
MAEPAICSDREPMVPPPRAMSEVSACTMRMRSAGIPRILDASTGKVVSWLWPCDTAPLYTVADPSSSTSTAPQSLRSAGSGDLDITADADTQLNPVAARSSFGLILPQSGVPGGFESLLQGCLVVACVVALTGGGHPREGVGCLQVPASNLGRVHRQLRRQQIHHPFQRDGGFGASSTPVGVHRRRVGHDAASVIVDLRDGVGARGHAHGERCHHRPEQRVAAAVLQHLQLHPDDATVTGGTHLHAVMLSPTVIHGHHVLGAALVPPNRSPELHGEGRADRMLPVGVDLGAEATTHVRYPDPDLGSVDVESGRDGIAGGVHLLCADPDVDAVAVGDGESIVGFQRDSRQSLIHDYGRHDHIGTVEGVGRVDVEGDGHVGSVFGEQHGGVVGNRRVHVGDDGERVDVEPHGLGGVDGVGFGVGDDHGDDVAHVTHAVGCDQLHPGGVALAREIDRHRSRQLIRTEDSDHAGHGGGLTAVHRQDDPMRHLGSDRNHPHFAIEVDVFHVASLTGDETRIFGSLHGGAQDGTTGQFRCGSHETPW